MQFKNPQFFLLLLLWIPMLWLYLRREKKRPSIRFSDLSVLKTLPKSRMRFFRHAGFVMRCLGVGLLIVALARPQKGTSEEEISNDGIDIMLVLDVSVSMHALDFQPNNRLFVAKKTMEEFIQKRKHDRIGLVVFGSRSYTKCPLTLDYSVLNGLLESATFEDFSDATAIGTALATAANRLKDSKAKSKVIILLTDGANNAGELAPRTAAEAIGQLGIKIYAIGVGREGMVPMPMTMQDPFTGAVVQQIQNIPSDLDESLLGDIAHSTGGQYFRAQNANSLKAIYDKIDKMEKTKINSKLYTSYADKFYLWLVAGALLLFAEALLSHTWLRKLP